MDRLSRLLLVALFVMGVAVPASAAVWTTQNSWSESMEDRFSQWIARVPLNIFTDSSSRWSGLATDCADAAYALRIIFAYENRLPVRFQGSANLSNETSQFDGAGDELKKVRRFIAHVGAATNTRTIVQDTYPVRISRSYVRPGTLFVHAAGGGDVPVTFRPGHIYYLQEVRDNGVIKYISSTVPVMVRNLSAKYGIDFAPLYRNSGYRVWKWPDSSARPGYSEEQFGLANWRERAYRDYDMADEWQRQVRARISSRAPTSSEQLEAVIQNTLSALRDRSVVVQRSWKVYQSKYGGHGCMSAGDYDDYSTPTRDVKIQNELYNLQAAAGRYGRSFNDIASAYRFEIMPGYSVTIAQIWKTFMSETVLAVSEPEHSPEVRWGLRSQGRWPCPHRSKQYVGGDRANAY